MERVSDEMKKDPDSLDEELPNTPTDSSIKTSILAIKKEISQRLPIEIETHIPPNVLTITSDNSYYVIGSRKGTISLYNFELGLILKEVDYTTKAITSLVLNEPENILIASDKNAFVFSLDFPDLTYREGVCLEGVNPTMKKYSEHEVLVSCNTRDLNIISFTALVVRSLITKSSAATSFDISSSSVAIAYEGANLETSDLTLFDIRNSTHVAAEVTILKYTPNAQLVAGGLNNFLVNIWNSKLELVSTIDNHNGLITGLDYLKDGMVLITASKDSKIMAWNMIKRRSFVTLKIYNSPVTSLMCKETIIYSTQKNNMLLKWVDRGNFYNIRYRDSGCSIVDLEFFSTQRKIAVINTRGELVIWDYDTDEISYRVPFDAILNRMSISKCGDFILVGSEKPALYRVDLTTWTVQEINHTSIFTCIKFHSNQQWVITGDNLNRLIVWQLPEMNGLIVMKGHSKQITAVCVIESKGEVLTGSNDCTLMLWNLNTGENKGKFSGHTGPITSVRIQKNDVVSLSASLDGTIILWDIEKQLLLYTIHQRAPSTNMLSTQGERYIITANEGSVIFWDLQSQSKISSIHSRKKIKNIAISKDERLIAIAEEGTLYIRTNPMINETFDVVGMNSQYRYQFLKYVSSILNGNYSMEHLEEYNH